MESAIATARDDGRASGGARPAGGRRRRAWAWLSLRLARRRLARAPRWGAFSLTRRILAVNLIVLALLASGMLYLDRYERGLIDTELQALTTQGELFSAALGEGAVLQDYGAVPVLVPSLAQGMMRRLVEPTQIRARLFRSGGDLVADSRLLATEVGGFEVEPLPPPETGPPPSWPQVHLGSDFFNGLFDSFLTFWRKHAHYQLYNEKPLQRAADYAEVERALAGNDAAAVRIDPTHRDGKLILSIAVPVRRYKLILGAVMLSVGSSNVEHEVQVVRRDILHLFAAALIMTVLLSYYLASTIAHPVRRLARAAYELRHGNGRKIEIPDFSRRHDEIGALSVALNEMTQALWRRMDAIERFAADVAHEIKNPLSSLRSAVETAARVQDPAVQRRLMAIIHDDVQRLDRLISDISDASRLDAEMSRLEREPVDLAAMLATLAEIHDATRGDEAPVVVFEHLGGSLVVRGKESRLVQVFRNLIGNAVSFSPPQGRIEIRAQGERREVVVTIDDRGPGIPEGKVEAIFDRFYTERPAGEKFGTHSGLGLSISKQIVEAHGGTIRAENRHDAGGAVIGARFVVHLPVDGL